MEKAQLLLGHLFLTVFLFNYAVVIVVPAMTDVTMSALCPGETECSLAIYLSGFQQGITGLGTLVMMPLVGNLSDKYGRKALLTVPLTLTIIPLAILAYSRSRNYFYAYYLLKTLTAMICEGSVHCLSLAYVADNVPEGRRVSAFGILSGIGSTAFVCATLSARFLSTASTFQVAVSVAIVAAVYMKIFLKDSVLTIDDATLSTPILPGGKGEIEEVEEAAAALCIIDEDPSGKMVIFKPMPSISDMISLLKTSVAFQQAAVVAFFISLAEFGLHASLLNKQKALNRLNTRACTFVFNNQADSPCKLSKSKYLLKKNVLSAATSVDAIYYLKARFFFNKDQYADLMVISGIGGTVSQLILMPMMGPALGEEKLLSIALFFSCVHMFLYSIAWSSWVPYAASILSVLFVFSQPCMRSIVSRQVGSYEQGKAQGCISGICSFANVISPLTFSPLTALFLSKDAPFHFPGFSIMCIGFSAMIAFIQSMLIRASPSKPSSVEVA